MTRSKSPPRIGMFSGNGEYPVWALLPKRETGVTAFLSKYPEYDGRGITIAIFDSGVDPGAPGLQVTSEGKRKIIGRYDCTGAGDIDTSTVVKPNNGTITGLTGRELKIPQTWKNPSGTYHVGVLNSYQIYPRMLKERMTQERRQKSWDPGFKTALAESNHRLAEISQNIDNCKGTISRTSKLQKENVEAQVEMLNQFEKKYEDLGPTYDCVLFNDGAVWRLCIDTSECGDLASCSLVGEYSKTYEFAPLTKEDVLNYSINVYDNGNLLEFVSLASSHGTHVASITAAYFPDEPEKNGVAPGAQLVSLSIGDQRINTMETGTGLARAMIKVMESQKTNNPITVINMSYGEQASWSCSGRVGDLMNEVIDKYGVTWVAAAGNHGPCLCTIGTPPSISTESIIGVGAYVSPEMMVAEYSLRSKAPGLPYTWTSRGPTMDGAKGVSVCAPGGAITSVPQYLLRSAQLLNGTSMASPHVAGAVAILLSGLKAKNIKHTPYSVKRALENTAQYLSNADYFAQGRGLLQVGKAFDHLISYNESRDNKVRFHVYLSTNKDKGILLRGGAHNVSKEFPVCIEPIFADSSNIDLKEKLDFQMSLSLSCDQSWVQHPVSLEFNNMMRTINVRVDPSGLPTGVHATSINAYDVKQVEKGPMFQIEITVINPYVLQEPPIKPLIQYQTISIKPGEIRRHFIFVPERASYATVKLSVLDIDRPGNFVIHAMQVLSKKSCRAQEYHKMAVVSFDTEGIFTFQVKGGITMELVLSKYWSEQYENTINYSIQFFGCPLESNEVTMHHSHAIHQLEILGGLQVEEISPAISLKFNVITLKPADAKITPGSVRDVIPPSRHIYQLMLTYNFHLPKQTEVMPNCALVSQYLYESEFESQLWMLFDSNKQYIASGDAYPKKYNVKLDKGDYTIKLQIRHEKRDLLEKLFETPMMLWQKLQNPISLDVYATQHAAVLQTKKLNSGLVPSGTYRLPIYISPIQNEKTLKNITPGQYLTGTLTLSKNDLGKKVDTYTFNYILSDLTKKSTNNSKNSPEKSKWEEYQEALRDLKTSWLAKMDNSEMAEKLYSELKEEFPSHVTSYMSMLQSMEPESKRVLPGAKETEEGLRLAQGVLKLANELYESIDQKSLLAYLGMKSDLRPEATTIKLMMEKQKNALIDSLSRKGAILCRLYLKHMASGESGDSEMATSLDEIDDLWLCLLKYAEVSDLKSTGYFGLWHAAAFGHYGRLLKLQLKMFEDKPSKELEESVVWCLENLRWSWAAEHISRSTYVRFPAQFRLV
ncbi:tripeptidyl-peptidase 2 isoform X2 [Cimex lectularius]|uniref:Tripeptidyl-peptidase 2 n=1 Tax=Cimex lectularius TaxID=79782 RepID=A0A8I6TAZ9_CIMLE|nr:tripeptidyl-peptidase 2 isoform X2 [Cimex lectularius]